MTFHIRVDALGCDASPARSAAAAERHDDVVHIGQVFHYLQRVCAHARDEQRLVDRVDIAVAFFLAEPLRVFVGHVEVWSVVNDLRAEAFDGRYLAGVRAFRHAGRCT